MDMTLTAEEQAFRDDVRAWLKDGGLPGWLSDKVRGGKRLGKQDFITWHQALISGAGSLGIGRQSMAALAGRQFRSISSKKSVWQQAHRALLPSALTCWALS